MTAQSTPSSRHHQRQSHRIGFTILASFSLLTLLVLLITFFSWRELKKQQDVLDTFAHYAMPQAKKITESHAVIQQMDTLAKGLATVSSPEAFTQINNRLQTLVEKQLKVILATSPDSHITLRTLLDKLEHLTRLVNQRITVLQGLQEQRAVLYDLHGQWITGIASLPQELSPEEKKLFMTVPRLLMDITALNWRGNTLPESAPTEHAPGQPGSGSSTSPREVAANAVTPEATEYPATEVTNTMTASVRNTAPGHDAFFSQTQNKLEAIKKSALHLPLYAQNIWNPLVTGTSNAILSKDGYGQNFLKATGLTAEIEEALSATVEALNQMDAFIHISAIASLNAVNTTAEQTETSLKIFSRFFILSSILIIFVASLTFIFYYKTFFKRIKHLQNYLLSSASGRRVQLTTEGNDEVSSLSHAIEHYVSETDRALELIEAASKAKSDFLVSINHEIRTPLNAIIGYTRMTNETLLTPTQKSYLDKIVQATHYLLGIMNTMLNFSKVETDIVTLEIAPFNLQESLDSATSFARSKAQAKGLVFEVVTDPALPAIIDGDALRLSQIINNLSMNAINYTHSGKIMVKVEPVRTEDSTIFIKFTVADEGIGMTAQQIDALFTPSTSTGGHTQPSFAGTTDLGLSISKTLCSLMGGTLTVDSTPGRGSTFSFTLSFELNAEASAAEASDNSIPDLSGRTILLAEDNLINQEIAMALLEKTNASVTIANNGLEATDLAQAHHYDLILMDIKMPMMSGIAATKNILEYHAAGQVPPIIAMTANAMDEDRQESLDAGMKDYITKPIESMVFYQMLRKWCLPAGDEKRS